MKKIAATFSVVFALAGGLWMSGVTNPHPDPTTPLRPVRTSLAQVSPVITGGETADSEREQSTGGKFVPRITQDKVLETLRLHGNRGQVPNHGRFLFDTVRLLQHDDSLCDALAAQFLGEAANHTQRAFILNLLAAAETPKSQRTMRELLDSPVAKNDPAYHRLVQRMSLVDHPDAASIEWTRQAFESQAGDVQIGAAFSLGAMTRTLRDDGKMEQAREEYSLLSRELDQAREPTRRRNLILALGNSGMPEVAHDLEPFARSNDLETRVAVADALRHVRTDEGHALLFNFLGDSDSFVQGAALRSLTQQPLTENIVAALRNCHTTACVAPENMAKLVEVVRSDAAARSGNELEGTRELLEGLQGHGDRATRLAVESELASQRARAALASL